MATADGEVGLNISSISTAL